MSVRRSNHSARSHAQSWMLTIIGRSTSYLFYGAGIYMHWSPAGWYPLINHRLGAQTSFTYLTLPTPSKPTHRAPWKYLYQPVPTDKKCKQTYINSILYHVCGASKIKLKKVNKKRTVTVRRVIIFLNISRHPLLICLQCCLHQYKTLKAVATATAAIVLLTPAKNLNKVFWGFLVVSPLYWIHQKCIPPRPPWKYLYQAVPTDINSIVYHVPHSPEMQTTQGSLDISISASANRHK